MGGGCLESSCPENLDSTELCTNFAQTNASDVYHVSKFFMLKILLDLLRDPVRQDAVFELSHEFHSLFC